MPSVEVRARVSWVNVPGDSDFTLYNLPYGVFSTRASSGPPHCGVAIGDSILDLAAVAHLLSCVQGLDITCFSKGALNAFMAHPATVWAGTRRRITALLEDGPEGCNDLRNDDELCTRALLPLAAAKLHLPAEIGDYTDFYASREHAYNCGSMFRSPETALQPNWLHLPVGYHGRASSVCISGTPVIRPQGQIQKDKNDASKGSVFANCNMLDFECEVGYFLGGPGMHITHTFVRETEGERE
jgi:fumarylacetoacetase